ncbi:MAG: hypothetical protein R2862_04280 [Thermoanaerobaculia bacterium]
MRTRNGCFVLALSLTSLLDHSPPLSAQPAYMVADLGGPVSFHWDDFFETNEIVEANGLMFFFQTDGSNGRELWRSDGTAIGTYMLRDLCRGSCGSRFMARKPLAAVGGHVFFAANDGVHGLELWVTDGTALGTEMVVDLVAGWESSFPFLLTEASGQLFFLASADDSEVALWRSDGTAKGTYRVSPPGVSFANATAMLKGQGFLYLCDGSKGGNQGLWRSDGTAAGTFPLAAVSCVTPYFLFEPQAALLPGGELIFAGDDGKEGVELWRSDGTPSGTTILSDLWPGPTGSQPQHFARLGSEVVFTAYFPPSVLTLWKTDGTPGGTTMVPLPPGTETSIGQAAFVADELHYYFAANDSTHGREPWVFDGITAQLLADVAPGPASSLGGFFEHTFFVVLNGVLVFPADDGVHGRELWRSDGTAPGTFRISELGAGSASMSILPADGRQTASTVGGRLYLFETASENGYRFLRTDGSMLDPDVIRIIDDQTTTFDPVARDRGSIVDYVLGRSCFEPLRSTVYFEHTRPSTFEPDLWRSDGSESGTTLALAGVEPGYVVSPCAATGDYLLYFDSQPSQQALRALPLDGTTSELILSGGGGSTLPPFIELAEGLAFAMADGIYFSDGASADLLTETAGAVWLAPWGDQVLFGGPGLTASQPGTTAPLELTPSHPHLLAYEIVTFGDRIAFVGSNPEVGEELWASSGEVDDSELLADIYPGPAGSLARALSPDAFMDQRAPQLVSLPASAVLAADDGVHGKELWVTDGTPLGTGLLRDIYPGDYPSTPRNFTRFGDRIFFTAESELEGSSSG